MFFTRVIAVFCGAALALAIGSDALLLAVMHRTGGLGFFAKSHRSLMIGWFLIFSLLWIAALALGWSIARKFRIWPLT